MATPLGALVEELRDIKPLHTVNLSPLVVQQVRTIENAADRLAALDALMPQAQAELELLSLPAFVDVTEHSEIRNVLRDLLALREGNQRHD
jgi:hypothetical protein